MHVYVACFKSRIETSVDPDQLVCQKKKPANLDLQFAKEDTVKPG